MENTILVDDQIAIDQLNQVFEKQKEAWAFITVKKTSKNF